MKRLFLTALMLGSFAVSRGWAATITITNPSFEDPASPSIQNGIATGWTLSNQSSGTWAPLPYTNTVPDGNQVLFVGYLGTAAEVSQTLGDNLLANTDYTLTFYVGRRTDMALSDYTVSLMAGGNILATDSGASVTAGDFVFRQLSWNSGANPAGLGSALQIDIHATGFSGTDFGQAEFDQFTLTSSASQGGGNPTPEPASMALMGAGLLLVGFVHKKKA